MAFDFKEKFDRSGISSLSGTIDIDRSILLESAQYRATDVAEKLPSASLVS